MSMARNNSASSLMGFSVHQPQLGAPLEFFPAMGSKQLDDMIDAYVVGNQSILDKRTAVTVEFFEHSLSTGELFKFFMVYPAAVVESPASSLQDSGYGSTFASPIIEDNQWNASTSKKARIASARGAAAAPDFSHIPGMKIMTRDGQDVTNSASRGCKTREQRDHAHLMRIMKACDACKKKKIRCDPSHKRVAGPSVADAKVKKSAKKSSSSSSRTVPIAAPPINPAQAFDASFDTSMDVFMTSFDVSEPADSWEQFVAYDDEPVAQNVSEDYDFFFDPAGHFSPTASFSSGSNSGFSSNSGSPSQSFSPVQATAASSSLGQDGVMQDVQPFANAAFGGLDQTVPSLPYMNPAGVDGSNYVDFNLFSPGSTSSLDDDLNFTHEVRAVSPSENNHSKDPQLYSQRSSPGRSRHQLLHDAEQAVGGGSRRLQVSSSEEVYQVSSGASARGLESSSAFAHRDEYGFDRGTEQRDYMITAVKQSRLQLTSQDQDGLGRVIRKEAPATQSQKRTGTGEPQVSESLVPRGTPAIPRPPTPPLSSVTDRATQQVASASARATTTSINSLSSLRARSSVIKPQSVTMAASAQEQGLEESRSSSFSHAALSSVHRSRTSSGEAMTHTRNMATVRPTAIDASVQSIDSNAPLIPQMTTRGSEGLIPRPSFTRTAMSQNAAMPTVAIQTSIASAITTIGESKWTSSSDQSNVSRSVVETRSTSRVARLDSEFSALSSYTVSSQQWVFVPGNEDSAMAMLCISLLAFALVRIARTKFQTTGDGIFLSLFVVVALATTWRNNNDWTKLNPLGTGPQQSPTSDVKELHLLNGVANNVKSKITSLRCILGRHFRFPTASTTNSINSHSARSSFPRVVTGQRPSGRLFRSAMASITSSQ